MKTPAAGQRSYKQEFLYVYLSVNCRFHGLNLCESFYILMVTASFYDEGRLD